MTDELCVPCQPAEGNPAVRTVNGVPLCEYHWWQRMQSAAHSGEGDS